jgi:hypothetical protein
MIDQLDRVEHAVPDEEHSAGLTRGDGVFLAICGRELDAATLTAEPEARCASCGSRLRTRWSRGPERSHRLSTLRRLLTKPVRINEKRSEV